MMVNEKITLNSSFIKLDQFLKWTGLAGSGSDAKWMIETGQVQVNQQVEVRRGRKIYPGDQVRLGEKTFIIGLPPAAGLQ